MQESSQEKLIHKIFPRPRELKAHLDAHHRGSTIVFTNGCFDLLHRGHISYLSRARDLGDLLVVGLNSDSSVKQIKGPSRPINGEEERAIILASLFFVDYVTLFSEDTPVETLKIIRPTIHTKGGDYRVEDLPETPVVVEGGGRVEILPFVEGFSTTGLIKRMNEETPS